MQIVKAIRNTTLLRNVSWLNRYQPIAEIKTLKQFQVEKKEEEKKKPVTGNSWKKKHEGLFFFPVSSSLELQSNSYMSWAEIGGKDDGGQLDW